MKTIPAPKEKRGKRHRVRADYMKDDETYLDIRRFAKFIYMHDTYGRYSDLYPLMNAERDTFSGADAHCAAASLANLADRMLHSYANEWHRPECLANVRPSRIAAYGKEDLKDAAYAINRNHPWMNSMLTVGALHKEHGDMTLGDMGLELSGRCAYMMQTVRAKVERGEYTDNIDEAVRFRLETELNEPIVLAVWRRKPFSNRDMTRLEYDVWCNVCDIFALDAMRRVPVVWKPLVSQRCFNYIKAIDDIIKTNFPLFGEMNMLLYGIRNGLMDYRFSDAVGKRIDDNYRKFVGILSKIKATEVVVDFFREKR